MPDAAYRSMPASKHAKLNFVEPDIPIRRIFTYTIRHRQVRIPAFVGQISLSAESLCKQFVTGRYGNLLYIVPAQLDQSEPTASTGGIFSVLLGLSSVIDIIVGVALLKFKDYLYNMAHRHSILLDINIIGG